MRSRTAIALLSALALPGLGFAQAAPAAPALPDAEQAAEPSAPELRNRRDPLAGVRTGGITPAAEQALFDELARQGFHVYVDLRTDREGLEAARAAAEAAGIDYVSLPIGDDADLDLGSVRALDAILDDPERGPAVVACASGNRSGALLALRAFWLDGLPAEEALDLGRRAGLTRSEPTVRTLLGLPALPAPEAPSPAQGEPAAPPPL